MAQTVTGWVGEFLKSLGLHVVSLKKRLLALNLIMKLSKSMIISYNICTGFAFVSNFHTGPFTIKLLQP